MGMDSTQLIVFGLVLLVVIVSFMRRAKLPEEPYLDFGKPKLYWFVDATSNARDWWDFGARRSVTPNRGYLTIALEACKRTQGSDFTVVPVIGRDATLRLISGANPAAKQLPPALWRQYAIAGLAASHGGLVLDGNSTLCVGPRFLPHLLGAKAAMFGVNPDEPVVSPATAVAPGPAPYAGWASEAAHPAWVHAFSVLNGLVLRGPQAWSSAIARRHAQTLWGEMAERGAVILRIPDGGRLATGKKRELEDLFGRVGSTEDPAIKLLPGTVYVPYDGEDLERRYEFSWFLRLSPEQIAESDLVWARLAGF
jgi:hypothetical protein